VKRLGIVGARGFVGGELVRLLANHDGIELALVSSRQLAGERICDHFDHPSTLLISNLDVADVPVNIDAWILALPNGHAAAWTSAIENKNPKAVVVDLSADFRFDDSWVYGLTEFNRDLIKSSVRISNPGCYATAIQFAVHPLLDVIAGVPQAFGVSGFSGAGTTPSPKNDPEQLANNLMPYTLVNHVHEREVTRHLGTQVRFMPHVASFFRGISVTLTMDLNRDFTRDEILQRYRDVYANEALIHVSSEIPQVRDNANKHHVSVGGFALDGRHLVVVATIDNLLKGAATQAMQNLNLALGETEMKGIQ
jgi:N-acetyl-gamma-glutamyl-phosphate reductase